MAINVATLFSRFGTLGKVLRRFHSYQSSQLAADVAAAQAALGTLYSTAAPLATALPGALAAPGIAGTLQAVARDLLLTTVNADTPLADRTSVNLAMAELIRQMVVQGESVADCTIGLTPSAGSGNTGTGAVVSTTRRGDGLIQQNVFAETGVLTCVGDAQGGTATAGGEPFQYRGDAPTFDINAYDWPGASGAAAGLTAIDSQSSGLNLLTNSGFETFTVADIPDGWAVVTGAAGSQVLSEASVVHRGGKALRFAGDGSTLTTISQTLTNLRPNRTYALNLYVRQAGSPAAGILSARLVDGSAAVVNDDRAAANALAIDCTALTTGYASRAAVFRTPKVMPAAVALRLEFTTALSNAASVYVDSLALGEMTFLYPGGPALAVFAGATPWVAGDYYSIAVTNDRASATFGSTFQTLFDRWFDMRGMGLMLPYSASETQADTSITA